MRREGGRHLPAAGPLPLPLGALAAAGGRAADLRTRLRAARGQSQTRRVSFPHLSLLHLKFPSIQIHSKL